MKFTKINLKEAPFSESWNDYTDFKNWHNFIKDNQLYSYLRGLPSRSTLMYYFENGRDVGEYLRNEENRPPFYDHGYMYKTKDRKAFIVYQPYGALDKMDEYRQVIECWATEQGIEAKVYGYDYGWYTSSSYLVIMGLDLSDIKVEKARNSH